MYKSLYFRLLIIFALFTFVFLTLLTHYYHYETITNHFSKEGERDNNNGIGLKTILLWNDWDRIEVSVFGTGHRPFIDHGCPISNCYIKAGSSELLNQASSNYFDIMKSFDAVLVIMFGVPITLPFNYERPVNQRLVWLSQESPINIGNKIDDNPSKFENIFNWTMSYKRDSDIQLLYSRIHSIQNRTQNDAKLRDKRRLTLANKTTSGTTVAWMVSNCNTKSRREAYVSELKKHIHVDVYGKCGNMSCQRNEKDWISTPECYEMINRKYKFYLSFENSICNDYVTEKFFSILQLDVVPVVLGGADYRAIAPKNSYINALDFDSPAKLAEYLHLLDGNDELYLDYLEWKSLYRIEIGVEQMARHDFCDLCAKLNNKDEPKKVYDSMVPHWAASTQCRPAWTK